MKKIAVYASNIGVAKGVCEKIAPQLGIEKIVDVKDFSLKDLANFDKILLVVSTHVVGEIQKDFNAQIDDFKALDLNGKTVALVTLGDGIGHGDAFNDALGELYDICVANNATLVGSSDPATYTFEETDSIRDGIFPGLALDVDNEAHLTDSRIQKWLETGVKEAF